jgi:hypothetical protein
MFMPNKVTVTNEDGSTTDFFPQSYTDAAVAAVTPVVANPIIEPGVAYTAGGNSAVQMLVLAPSAVTVTPRVYLASAAQAATAARYAGVAQGSASVGGSVTPRLVVSTQTMAASPSERNIISVTRRAQFPRRPAPSRARSESRRT